VIRTVFTLAATLSFFFCAPACADDDPKLRSLPTNLEMLEDLARRLVDESAVKIPLESGEIVLVRRTGDHAVGWIVENYLAGRLVALGASVYVAPEAPEGAKKESGAPGPGEEDTAGKRERPGAEDSAETAAGGQEAGFNRPGEQDTTAAFPDEGDESDDWPPKSFTDTANESSPGGTPEDDVSTMEGVNAPAGAVETSEETGSAAQAANKPYFQFEETPTPDLVLEFRVGELDVGYTRRWRKSLFGTAMVERSARAAIFFRLLDGRDGKILWTDSGRLQQKDVVPQKLLAELEDTPGQAGPRSGGIGGIGRVVEPIVVSGIVVGLVVLFYSSRT
jgi:hypothetical protein